MPGRIDASRDEEPSVDEGIHLQEDHKGSAWAREQGKCSERKAIRNLTKNIYMCEPDQHKGDGFVHCPVVRSIETARQVVYHQESERLKGVVQ